MDFLEIVDGNGRRKHVKLEQPRLLIGREASCDICLPHPNVSRRHAQLQKNDRGDWVLQDLNSLNHVYYCDDPVQQVVLEPGRPVRISEFRLLLRAVSDSAPESPSLLLPGEGEDSSPSWPGVEPHWLEQLQQFQRVLLRQEQPRPILARLTEEFLRIAHPEVVAVGLNAPEGYSWEMITGEKPGGLDESLRVASRFTESDESDVRSWHEGAELDETPRPSAPFCMLFPMKGRSGILGHVYVQKPRHVPMPPPIQRYLSLYANYAGLLWENLQMNALRVAQKAMELELSQARQIQSGLFPSTFDVDPRLLGFGVNLPSVRVSGDYYDLVKTGPDTVAFVIADAMGHGIGAALMMATVRATLRMGLTMGLSWDDLFRGLDTIIAQARANSFVTGVIGQVNLAARTLDIAIAGHLPPSILVGGELIAVPDGCQTRPWGVDFEADWTAAHLSLGPADWSILCFTDGLTDAMGSDGKAFGMKGVTAFHRANRHANAEDLCQGLLNAVASRQISTTLADDQTVLVLRSAT